MEKQGIKTLLENNMLDDFEDIFRMMFYHRTKISKSGGIGYYRLCTTINDPSKMTIGELLFLAEHFEVQESTLLAPIVRQIRSPESGNR